MVAGIAHLRGYDLDDPRVRNAILTCMLGRDSVDKPWSSARKLPAPPMALATAPHARPELARQISAEVAGELVARVAGKRLAVTVGRKVPVVGGLVGLGADGINTWRVGRYADAELPAPRAPVGLQQPGAERPLLQAADGLLPPAVRRAQVGALQRAVGLVELLADRLLRRAPGARSRRAAP